MATEETSGENVQEPAKKKKLLTVVIAVALGLLAGGGAGAFAAGSLLPKTTAAETTPAAEKPAAEEDHAEEEETAPAEEESEEPAEEESHEEEPAEESSDGGHGGTATGSPTYLMENLVLNPAGTGGTRFLMVSAAFGVKDEASVETLKARDHEIRDAMLSVLGTKTVGQLADIAMRDSLKTELKKQVGGLFPRGTVKRVYFPQFVIQ